MAVVCRRVADWIGGSRMLLMSYVFLDEVSDAWCIGQAKASVTPEQRHHKEGRGSAPLLKEVFPQAWMGLASSRRVRSKSATRSGRRRE